MNGVKVISDYSCGIQIYIFNLFSFIDILLDFENEWLVLVENTHKISLHISEIQRAKLLVFLLDENVQNFEKLFVTCVPYYQGNNSVKYFLRKHLNFILYIIWFRYNSRWIVCTRNWYIDCSELTNVRSCWWIFSTCSTISE